MDGGFIPLTITIFNQISRAGEPSVTITDPLINLVFQYSYGGLFLAMSLGIVGVPLPDEVLLTASGYLISTGEMHLFLTMIAAIGGSVTGMSISYWLGRKVGPSLFGGVVGRMLGGGRLERLRLRMEKWGDPLLLLGFFVPGVRHATALLYGAGKRPYGTFLFYTAVGALLWTSVFLLVGRLLGEHWRDIAGMVNKDAALAAVFFLLAGLGWRVWKRSFSANKW